MSALDGLFAMVAGIIVIAVAIPAVRARRRWRRLLRRLMAAVPPHRDENNRTAIAASLGSQDPSTADHVREPQSPLRTLLAARRRWVIAGAGAGAGAVGFGLAGPVAGAVLACYAAAGIVLVARRTRVAAEARSRVVAVDAVAALAAELRAGVAVTQALAAVRPAVDGPGVVGTGARAVRDRLAAAIDLAETSGAPLADVLDRLDAHLRAAERARATAEAQAAGARASAGLLAVMPVAGAGLGVLVGLDPATVLLHTPIGAACLAGAVVLQLAGLGWSARLSRVEVTA